jgi:hypothetical protein
VEFIEDSIPFPVAEIRQETPQFCFIACIQSMLRDSGTRLSQREILEKFPFDLRKGHATEEGAPIGLKPIENVLVGLRLSAEPLLSGATEADFEEMIEYLAERPSLWPKTLLVTTADPFHCLRLAKVRDDGLIVMDPGPGRLMLRTLDEIRTEKIRFILMEQGHSDASNSPAISE